MASISIHHGRRGGTTKPKPQQLWLHTKPEYSYYHFESTIQNRLYFASQQSHSNDSANDLFGCNLCKVYTAYNMEGFLTCRHFNIFNLSLLTIWQNWPFKSGFTETFISWWILFFSSLKVYGFNYKCNTATSDWNHMPCLLASWQSLQIPFHVCQCIDHLPTKHDKEVETVIFLITVTSQCFLILCFFQNQNSFIPPTKGKCTLLQLSIDKEEENRTRFYKKACT